MFTKYIKLTGILLWTATLVFAGWLMVRLSLPYTAMRSDIDFLLTKQNIYHIAIWRYCFYAHVFTSILVLPAGLTQFNRFWLYQLPRWHKNLGLLYIVTVLFIAAPTGFVMGWYANGGWAARASFILLASVWFTSTMVALLMIKRRDFYNHGGWMLCSYALALSAITLRSYALIFDVLHINMQPRNVYITIAWLSWLPNLMVAAALIRTGFVCRLLKNNQLAVTAV